jgi:hypothetical protein
MATEEMTRRIRGALAQPGDGHARYLQVAWQRVARDAEDLASVYAQARVPTVPATSSLATFDSDQVSVPVWMLTAYRPGRRVRSRWGWRGRTETIPEIAGIALGADATLFAYVLVKGRPMLTAELRDAKPGAPPSHAMFAELAARHHEGRS